jgi:hypothetical protein
VRLSASWRFLAQDRVQPPSRVNSDLHRKGPKLPKLGYHETSDGRTVRGRIAPFDHDPYRLGAIASRSSRTGAITSGIALRNSLQRNRSVRFNLSLVL